MGRQLYTGIPVNRAGYLQVSNIHRIYFEECGSPEGLPVVFLHGGPGGGIQEPYRGFFDPNAYRVILFDQRGCGKSQPHSELEENTTWDLVQDIEKLRHDLGIEKWLVFGGSWGSTLALTYGIQHPERVCGLILRGIFLLRPSEIQWFYQFGASEIFPDAFEKYTDPIPESERGNLLQAFYRRLTSESKEVRLTAAKAWSVWEATTSKLHPDPHLQDSFARDDFADAFARIECHYFVNKGFFPTDNYILENVQTLRDHKIPGVIIQGRYDVVCPARSAWDLHRAWPEASLHIVPDAGHSAFEPGILSLLLDSTDAMVTRIRETL